MSELVLEKKKEESLITPKCPVCGKQTVRIDTHFHCGRVVLLSEVNDHYLGFNKLPDQLPKTGCPICGKPMQKAGRFRWILSGKEEGLPRMHCDQSDHYCFVTEEWYQINRR